MTVTLWKNEFILNTARMSGSEERPILARFSDGSFIAVWEGLSYPGGDGTGSGGTIIDGAAIIGRIFNADGTPRTGEFIVNSTLAGPQRSPSLTVLSDDRFVVSWDDWSGADGETVSSTATAGIRARIFNPDGSAYDSNGDGVGDLDFHVNTTVTDQQDKPSVTALSSGGFVVIYQSEIFATPAIGREVRAQAYDATGKKIGGEINVNIRTASQQSIPVVTGLDNNRYAVIWQDAANPLDPSSPLTVVGRIMTTDPSTGATTGSSEILISSSRGVKLDIAATTLSNGRFVVTWTQAPGDGGDGNGTSIKAQIVNADGTLYRSEFLVNTPMQSNQGTPTVIAIPDGGFAVSYTDNSTGRTQARIAIFDSQGGRSIDEYSIDLPPGASISRKTTLTLLADGRLVVTWDDVSAARADDNASIRGEIIDIRTKAIDLSGTSKNDEYYGTIYNDKLAGGGGNDKLVGDLGSDTLKGGLGADTLHGGREGITESVDGIDFASYADSTDGLTVSLLTPAINTGEAAGDVYFSIEGLIGSSHADQLYGDHNANTLYGGADNDRLYGNGGADLLVGEIGDDVLDGGAGADILRGGKGDDTYFVDNSLDVVEEAAGEGYDVVTASANFALGSSAEIEELHAAAGTASINLTGNGISNKIYGNDGANKLDGGAGADVLEGFLGDDTYVIDDAGDSVIETGAAGGGFDTVAIARNFAADSTYRLADYVNIEALQALNGIGNVDLVGNGEANTLTGNDGNNLLEGKGGNDLLDGGGGIDTAVFTGVKADYIITKQADGSFTVADTHADRDGTDTLKNIKYVKFSDGTIDLLSSSTISIAAANAAQSEGNVGEWTEFTFTVTRSNSLGNASVDWTVVGRGSNAASADDFYSASDMGGKVEFADGEATQTITVKVKVDKDIEETESFSVVLSNSSGATIVNESATGIIINDDTVPTLSIVSADAVKAEGNVDGWTEFTFTVIRSAGLGSSTVDWQIAGIGDNPAQSDDFDLLSGQVSFGNGETTQTITVKVRGDKNVEQNEDFKVILLNPDNASIAIGSANGTIVNDDTNLAPSNLRLTTGGATAWIDENKPAGTVVATVVADDDAGAAGLRYSMSSSDTFEIDAVTGQIRVKTGTVLDFEETATYTVAVTATDLNGTGLSVTRDMTINLNDIAERAVDIAFDDPHDLKVGVAIGGTRVAVARAIDLDATGADANLYRFDNGQTTTSDGLFVINAKTGEISAARALTAADVGAKTLNVVAYDATNTSLFQVRSHVVTILAEDNAAPTDISLSKTSIDENSAVGALIGLLSAVDPQGASDIKDFSILVDEDEKFVIEGNELRLKAGLDREVKGSHQVTVRVTDKGGKYYDETLKITVGDVNEKPTDITFSEPATLKLGTTGVGSNVLTATAVDLDTTPGYATNLYRFENGQTTADGLFTIDIFTGRVTMSRALTAADVGTKTLVIVAYDASNSMLFHVKTQSVAILGPDNVAPSGLALDHTSIAENSAGKSVVGKLSATDGDGDTLTYSILTDPDGKFDIIGGNLVLKEGATLDYETKSSHKVTIRVTDGKLFSDKEFTIDVADINEAPTHVGISAALVDEGAASGTFVGNLITTDEDASGLYTYELMNNADGRFKLSSDGKSILVADGSKLDYETASFHTIQVKVKDGSFSHIEDIRIDLNNKLEAGSPSIIVDPALRNTRAPDDGTKVNPFTGVTFFDPDHDNLTVRISFNASAGQLLIREGLEIPDPELGDDGIVTYTFTGSYDALAIIMDVLQFQASALPNSKVGTAITTTFTIEAFDGTSLVTNKDVKVTAVATNRAPTGVTLDNSHVSEISGGEVGTLLASDQAGDEFTYELVGSAGGRFKLETVKDSSGKTITKVVAVSGLLLDYEQATFHTIRVKVTDKGGASYEKDLVINVDNVAVEDINGSAGNDVFVGGAGRDILRGFDGDDTLNGGAGIDRLVGGLGRDVFVFNTALNSKTNKDKIEGWAYRDDTIHLENAIFKALKNTGVLKKANFVLGAVAKHKADYIGYNKKTGDLWYDSNGNKAGGHYDFANIGAHKKIYYSDFLVI